jgi:hypothetical protein
LFFKIDKSISCKFIINKISTSAAVVYHGKEFSLKKHFHFLDELDSILKNILVLRSLVSVPQYIIPLSEYLYKDGVYQMCKDIFQKALKIDDLREFCI